MTTSSNTNRMSLASVSSRMRELTEANDILLVFDEVVTGFRLAYGGAQEYFNVTPDLCTLGKAIGGGFPLSAIAGKEEVMSLFDQKQAAEGHFVPQVGTLSGNPIAIGLPDSVPT